MEEVEQPALEKDDSCVFTDGAEDVTEEENYDPQNAFVMPVERRGYLGNKSKATGEKHKEKGKTCSHFLRGICRWGMSGRRPVKGGGDRAETSSECQYEHPRVCSKLLNHGDGKNTRWGCDGSSCNKSHPKMCTTSMNSRKCWKRCEKGWHVKGTKFEDGDIPVEKVQQNVQNTPNIENSQEYP